MNRPGPARPDPTRPSRNAPGHLISQPVQKLHKLKNLNTVWPTVLKLKFQILCKNKFRFEIIAFLSKPDFRNFFKTLCL